MNYKVVLGCISLMLRADASSFSQQLREYKPRATWICRQLMAMPVDKARASWKKVVRRMSRPEKYFGKKNPWLEMVAECQIYEYWLSHTSVDGTFLVEDDKDTLMNLWKKDSHLWYLLYIECLSHYFYQLVKAGYKNLTNDSFSGLFEKAKRIVDKIQKLIPYVLDPELQLLLKRYKEVLDVLHAESVRARE